MQAFLLVLYLFQQPLQDAVTLVRQGQFEQARKKLEGQPEPENQKTRVAYHRLRAAVASGLHHYPEAADEMKTALSLAPGDESLKAATGYALIEANEPDGAVEILKKANPSASALTLLGIAWYAKGEFKEAESSLNLAIVADPKYEPAYRTLSEIVLESSATPSTGSATSLCRWNQVVCHALELRSARASGDKHAMNQAVSALRQASADNRVARCALGQAYGWSDDWPAAQKELEACVALNPTPQNHYRLAMAFRHLGKAAQAREQLNARSRLLGSQSEDSAFGRETLRELPH